MKTYFLASLLIVICYTGFSQTKLIRHKSHCGTNTTFIPSVAEGNFGFPGVLKELKEDSNSTYKLIEHTMSTKSLFTLFKTKIKTLDRKVCLADDIIIKSISVEKNDKEYMTTKKQLIVELKKYRKAEKENRS